MKRAEHLHKDVHGTCRHRTRFHEYWGLRGHHGAWACTDRLYGVLGRVENETRAPLCCCFTWGFRLAQTQLLEVAGFPGSAGFPRGAGPRAASEPRLCLPPALVSGAGWSPLTHTRREVADAAPDGGDPRARLLQHAGVESGRAKVLAIDHPGHAAPAPPGLPWEEGGE